MGGPSVIEGYLGGDQIHRNDSFCQDGNRTWFKSGGDAASMKNTGEVFIQGRYKDMINRGGESMSPGYIEYCIDGIDGVQVCQSFCGTTRGKRLTFPFAVSSRWPC